MTLALLDIRQHQIWLTKKGQSRSHTVTRQFFNEEVYATASVVSTSWFDAETMAGFTQSVSASGVENFGYRTLNLGEDFVGRAGHEASVLRRSDVTSLTFELFGDGGASAQFSFFILSADGKGGEGPPASEGDVKPQSWLGFDEDGRLQGLHEFIGDEKFQKAQGDDWAKRWTGGELTYVQAEPGFRLDPELIYRLGKKGVIKAEKPKPKTRSAK